MPSFAESEPPAPMYTQAEAYAPMEQAVADAVAVLPDFPGFAGRTWQELPCSHNGVDDPDYTNVEISYAFGEELWQDPLVRESYLDVLREYWTEQGYDIHRDDASGTGKYRSLEARREDGINLWYRVAAVVGLTVQSGCVPKSDIGEIAYIPPAGGVQPDGNGDGVDEYFPDGIPTEGLTSEATDPFGSDLGSSTEG